MLKIGVYLGAVAIFILCGAALINRHEVALIRQFAAMQQVDPLIKAKELEAAGEYCQAIEYLEYFQDYDYVKSDPEVSLLSARLKDKRESLSFIGSDIASGILKGKGACAEALVSATASDFFLVGDVRDLALGMTKKYYYGEEADEFTMALASVGIVAAGVAYMSGGAAVPVKGSVSLLKAANKVGKLPPSLQKSLVKVFKEAGRTGDLKPVMPAARSLYAISRTPNLKAREMFSMLSLSKNIGDFKVMEKVASTYGPKTGKFIQLGGDAPVSLVRRFPHNKQLVTSVDTAIKYGSEGTNLLAKTGPTKFMRYVTLTKYSARAGRSVWEGRLSSLLVKTLQLFPERAIAGIGLLSGLIAVGVPVGWLFRRVRFRRARLSRTGHPDIRQQSGVSQVPFRPSPFPGGPR